MHVTIVHVHVRQDCISEFIEATRLNHEASTSEAGNLRFDVLQSADDPARFILYESYRSADDAAAHKQTAHYRAWRDTVADCMAEPRQGILYRGLFPQDP